MNLHRFGLLGVPTPSYYESNPDAIREAAAAFELKSHLLAKAPNLSLLIASDPENAMQARAKAEVLSVLEAALEMRGLPG